MVSEKSLSPSFKTWILDGGVAANGIRYAPPSRAIGWGNSGCPLLPREVRECYKGIELPQKLALALGRSLTVDQLDRDILDILDIDILPASITSIIREYLYGLQFQDDQVVIPAGIPLAWFESLPLSGRTKRAVWRAFQFEVGTDSLLSEPVLASQFLAIRSVGVTTLNELTCVTETAEIGRTGEDFTTLGRRVDIQQEISGEHELESSAAIDFAEGIALFNNEVSEFAKWAMAETDAQTFGEAIVEFMRAGAANEVWKSVASAKLSNLAVPLPHPYELLDRWMERNDLRSRAIFMGRLSCHPGDALTLEDLSAGFGVTRERIRQVEVKVRHSLDKFLESSEAVPIWWRAATLRQTLRVAAPVNAVDHLLVAPPDCNDHRGILLELAGPYDYEDDWLTLRSAQAEDPTSAILAQTDEVGRLDREIATVQLTYWGLDASLHERWLTRDDSVRLFNGDLVLWGTSISDRLAFALADMGRPATVDEMVNHVSEDRARTSINNALAVDPRLVRVNRTQWGLASWGNREYSGVADAMRRLLVELGRPISIHEMTRRVKATFGIAENSTLAYCGAPMFLVEGESIRLRTLHDEPFRCDPDSIRRTPGVFNLGYRRLGRLLKVDANLLRGSGTMLTHAAGAILEVEVNSNLSFTNRYGDQVQVTFPETSIVGPSIGSMRRIAERLSAKEDDYLTVVLDRSNMTVTAKVTDLSNQSPGWRIISSLTGVAEPIDLAHLANALQCDPGEVRSVLKARGDDDVLAFLPRSEVSSGLDDALAALEDHFEQFHEGSQ